MDPIYTPHVDTIAIFLSLLEFLAFPHILFFAIKKYFSPVLDGYEFSRIKLWILFSQICFAAMPFFLIILFSGTLSEAVQLIYLGPVLFVKMNILWGPFLVTRFLLQLLVAIILFSVVSALLGKVIFRKNYLKILRLAIIFIVSTFIFAMIINSTLFLIRTFSHSPSSFQPVPLSSTSNGEELPASISPDNILDPFQNKQGDIVAGLKLQSVTPFFEQDQLSLENLAAQFDGQITLTGTYDYSYSDLFGAGKVYFAVKDKTELNKLPRLKGEENVTTIGFSFKNMPEAIKAFGPNYSYGTATILIDQYEIQSAPTEVGNEARLVTVISKEPK